MLILSIIFSFIPEIISWQNHGKIVFHIKEENSFLEECIKSSEYKFRIQYKLCYRRDNWFDNCDDIVQQNNWINFNPITGIYQVKKDLLRDDQAETVKTFDDLDSAVESLSKIYPIKLSDLKKKNPKWYKSSKKYISVRFNSECKNTRGLDYFMLRVFSLGMISNKETESEWVDFKIKKQ